MGRRRYRRLAVGAETYRWRVAHEHTASGCREVVTLARDGSPGRISVVFRAGAELLVADALLHSGAVMRIDDGAVLNLHRPAAVRALLDALLAGGHGFAAAAELDGLQFFDAVRGRGSVGGSGR